MEARAASAVEVKVAGWDDTCRTAEPSMEMQLDTAEKQQEQDMDDNIGWALEMVDNKTGNRGATMDMPLAPYQLAASFQMVALLDALDTDNVG